MCKIEEIAVDIVDVSDRSGVDACLLDGLSEGIDSVAGSGWKNQLPLDQQSPGSAKRIEYLCALSKIRLCESQDKGGIDRRHTLSCGNLPVGKPPVLQREKLQHRSKRPI